MLRCDIQRGPVACAGWGDLPGEVHREILRLVPLHDATAARRVWREMRDEVDEVWRAWGIRATAADRRDAIRERLIYRTHVTELECGPLAVYACDGSHAHHLASLGLWWLAMLVAEATGINGMSWAVRDLWHLDQSPLMVAVRARRPVGRGADGEVEWAYALGEEEVGRGVRAAVAMGADVNVRLHRAWPLMTYCAARGCLGAVKACLAARAEVDAANFIHMGWWTAVVHAGRGGHEAVVEALLEAGASAKVGHGGRDQTLAAVCGGHPTPVIVRRLAEAGADVNSEDVNGTALRHAARHGNVALLKVLVEFGADVAVATSHGHTAMHKAANGEVVRWLAAHGASVQGDGGNDSPLQSACSGARVDAVRALIELGADVGYRDRQGGMALHRAAGSYLQQSSVEATQLLLAAGADVTAVDREGRTPLHKVMCAPVVDLLLDAGADLEARDESGRTPICIAALDLPLKSQVALRMADRGADLVNTGGEPGLVQRQVAKLRAEHSAAGPA